MTRKTVGFRGSSSNSTLLYVTHNSQSCAASSYEYIVLLAITLDSYNLTCEE